MRVTHASRRACLPFHAELGPLEQRREIVVETPWPFSGDRLILKTIARGPLELVAAWARHLVVVAFHNAQARALRLADNIPCGPAPEPEDLEDDFLSGRRALWGWRLGPKAPPVVVNAVNIEALAQIPGLAEVPAELFTVEALPLRFDHAPAGSRISLVVSSLSRKPFLFQASMFGDVFAPVDGEG